MNNDFKSGDIIVAKCGIFIFEKSKETFFKVYCGLYNDGKIRDYDALIQYDGDERYATDDEKKLMFDTFKKNGYKWYSSKNKLRKKNCFYIHDVIKNKITGKILVVGGINHDVFGNIIYNLYDTDKGLDSNVRHIKQEAFNNWSIVDF